jgi:hypothetical protein
LHWSNENAEYWPSSKIIINVICCIYAYKIYCQNIQWLNNASRKDAKHVIHEHIDQLMKQIDLHDPSSSYYNVKKCAWIFLWCLKNLKLRSLICSTFRNKPGNLKERCEIRNISWNTKFGLSSYRKTHNNVKKLDKFL